MARLIRVDAELVRRGLASSRRHAQELVESGLVRLSGETVRKSARQMDPAQPLLVVEGERDEYVSRGARKLAGALDALGEAAPAVAGRRCLDAGASTGGFTDVLLRRGAAHVVAVDVSNGASLALDAYRALVLAAWRAADAGSDVSRSVGELRVVRL